MTAQIALGDRDTPIPTTPDTVPTSCYWWTDPDGDLCLMPGCMARIQNPTAECTCDKLAHRLQDTKERLRDMQEQERYVRSWNDAIVRAVRAHPDAAQIMRAASEALPTHTPRSAA